MNPEIFSGTIPALMTPCKPDRTPDFDKLVEKAQELIGLGMSAVVYCGSMGDWPLLTNEWRMEGVERLVKAGIKVVVGTGAVNTATAAAIAAHAQKVGAHGLMVIPRLLSRGTVPAAQKAHFKAVLSAAPNLPAVIYNSPYYGYSTKADLFFQIRAEHPNLVGFKEFGGFEDLSYAGEAITSSSDDIKLMIGVDTAVFHGYVNCNADGAITGIGNVFPREVLHLTALCKAAAAGDAEARRLAYELDTAMQVLSKVDAGPDLVLFFKHMLVLQGNEAFRLHFNESDALSPSQQGFVEKQFALFNAWYADWSKQPAALKYAA
jgi:dihydrodipicolinate synthase/N-acetylneuraminate lyase